MFSRRWVIHGDRGVLRYEAGSSAIFERTGDRDEAIDLSGETQSSLVERFAAAVRGDADARQLATLEIARAHVIAVNGASQAARIYDVPPAFVSKTESAEAAMLTAIADIESIFASCAESGQMPFETGVVPWAHPAGRMDLRGYAEFVGG